jgi:hypothetical protein
MRLSVLGGVLAVSRLRADEPLPGWFADAGPVASVTRTAEELSVVCSDDAVPDGLRTERGWRAIKLHGPIPFTETGVLAKLLEPLGDAGVPIFALSTFDTDYVLVPGPRLAAAVQALRNAGHHVDA